MLFPRGTFRAPGVADSEKSGVAGALTVSDTVVVCVRAPLLPLIVNVYVPAGVVVLVATVMEEEPEPITDGGLKLAVAPAGNPLALNVTIPVKPPEGVTVTV